MWPFLKQHPISAIAMVLGSAITVGSRVNDAYSLFNARLPSQAWEAIGAAIFFLAVIALLFRWHRAQSQPAIATGAIPMLQGSGPNHSPLAEVTETAPRAKLRLLMRPQQDPEELTNENVYRWFAFRSLAQHPKTKKVTHLGTYIFLVFRVPVIPSYKRVSSPTHPNLRLEVIDMTSRSMVVSIDESPDGATLEMIISEKPV